MGLPDGMTLEEFWPIEGGRCAVLARRPQGVALHFWCLQDTKRALLPSANLNVVAFLDLHIEPCFLLIRIRKHD